MGFFKSYFYCKMTTMILYTHVLYADTGRDMFTFYPQFQSLPLAFFFFSMFCIGFQTVSQGTAPAFLDNKLSK